MFRPQRPAFVCQYDNVMPEQSGNLSLVQRTTFSRLFSLKA